MSTENVYGVLMIAGAVAGMVFGVIDPVTGITVVGSGYSMLGSKPTPKKPIDLKGLTSDEKVN